uniref:CSON003801 protein n=1 Tax=Culicoides sonorensis TaxID=179676 RepID=A0A336MM92_CULSO
MMRFLNKIPTINSFLYFFDLRIGSIITAVFGIIMCSIDSPTFIFYIRYFQSEHKHMIYEDDPTMVFDFILFIITLLGIAALSIILLIGAYNNDKQLVGIYKVGMVFCLGIMLIVTIMSIFLPAFSFWADLVFFLLYVYGWFTAHSLHQKLESGANLT